VATELCRFLEHYYWELLRGVVGLGVWEVRELLRSMMERDGGKEIDGGSRV